MKVLKILESKHFGSSKGSVLLLLLLFFWDNSVSHSHSKGLPKKLYGYLFMTAGILLLKPMDEFEPVSGN